MIWTARKTTQWTLAMLAGACSLPVAAMGLGEALDRAIQHDPLVPYSVALYEADRELGGQIAGQLRPSISLDGNYAKTDTESESQFFGNFEEDYKSNAYGVSARQPLYRYDWSARGRHAEALDQQAEVGALDRKNNFYVRVAERYFAVLEAQNALLLAESEVNAIGESLADTRKRYEVGLVPGTDLKEAQARDDLARARLILARQELDSARDALDESTGTGYEGLPMLPPDTRLPPLAPADMQAWVGKVVQNNAEVQRLRQERVVAESQAKGARAGLLPQVDAVASYRQEDSSDSRVGSDRTDARIGLELTVPIYQGGVARARSRESAARMRAADANLKRVQAEIERQARQQYRQLEAAYAQEQALKLAVSSAHAAEEATRNGYTAGTRTITDVLNARSAMISAERDYAKTRYDILLGRMRLKQLAAELDKGDFAEVDALLVPVATSQDDNKE